MRSKSPEILKRLVRRVRLVLLLAFLGAAAGAVYAAVATPMYRAQAYVVATAEPGESIAALNFAQAYGRVAALGPVADRAAATLGSRAGLDRVTASTSPDAPVIEITASGTDAARTAAVANAMAAALVDFGTASKGQTRVGLALLAPASTPAAPSSPRPPLELAVGAAGGLLIGGLAALAGVGRSAAATRRQSAAAPYPADHVDLPATGPAITVTYRAQALASPEPEAITWHGEVPVAGAVPLLVDRDRAAASPEAPAPGEKSVGRAVVDYGDPA